MRTNSNQKSLGDVSTSPAGQGCLWATAVGVVLVMAFSYLSTWSGAPSGALVFGAGTVQWAWGLDDQNLSAAEILIRLVQTLQHLLLVRG